MDKQAGFLKILQSVDAFFPIGAFTLSNGLEDYVMREWIVTGADLERYLKGFLQIFPYNDLGFLAQAYLHVHEKEILLQMDEMAAAVKAASEVRVGSIRICNRYLKARAAMGDCSKTLKWYRDQIQQKAAYGIHPIALGLYGAENKIALQMLLTMYGYSVLSGIVNNTVKLVPLSQMEGQRILFDCLEPLEQVIQKAMKLRPESLGVSGNCYEIHCMLHEKLYSRQYMS